MSLSELRRHDAATRPRRSQDASVYRFYADICDQIATSHADSEEVVNKVEWLLNPDGSNLSDVPDVLMLHAQAVAKLPANHPKYQATIPTGELETAYRVRSHATEFHTAAAQAVGRMLPQPVGQVEWPAFKATWPVWDSSSIQAAWALRLILAREDYVTAHEVLTHCDLATPLTHVAWLALYWQSQRFTELHEVATRARSAVFPDSRTGQVTATDDTLQAVAAACDGWALASLGRNREAEPMVTTAQKSQLAMAAAWGYYIDGMMERAAGRDKQSYEALSQSLQIVHTPFAARALSDESQRMRVTSTETIAARTSYWDPTTEPDPEMERRRSAQELQASYRARADRLMDRIIGMDGVKAQVKRMRNSIRINEERRRRSGSGADKPSNYNTVLLGPPGTGKSTIVKTITLYLAAEGLVDDPEPLITGKADFVSGYVGQTPEKTMETVNKARGKVLFIDEFYDMVQDTTGGSSGTENHGQDAIDTLVGLMEERIGTTVFIIAGYPDDMARVLQTNAGLESRFPRRIRFASFDQAQLTAVAVKDAEDRGMRLSEEATVWLADETSDARLIGQEAPSGRRVVDVLGNGRFARNIVERACEELAQRLEGVDDLSALDDAALETLTKEDVQAAFAAYVNSALYGTSTE